MFDCQSRLYRYRGVLSKDLYWSLTEHYSVYCHRTLPLGVCGQPCGGLLSLLTWSVHRNAGMLIDLKSVTSIGLFRNKGNWSLVSDYKVKFRFGISCNVLLIVSISKHTGMYPQSLLSLSFCFLGRTLWICCHVWHGSQNVRRRLCRKLFLLQFLKSCLPLDTSPMTERSRYLMQSVSSVLMKYCASF